MEQAVGGPTWVSVTPEADPPGPILESREEGGSTSTQLECTRASEHNPGYSLPGDKGSRELLVGNYPGSPSRRLPGNVSAKWALWQLEGLAGRVSRRRNRWLAWVVGREASLQA